MESVLSRVYPCECIRVYRGDCIVGSVVWRVYGECMESVSVCIEESVLWRVYRGEYMESISSVSTPAAGGGSGRWHTPGGGAPPPGARSPPAPHSPHCTALHCTELHCTALYCIALHCTALKIHVNMVSSDGLIGRWWIHLLLAILFTHCTALHCTALHCTALHCTALHCSTFIPGIAPALS
jgi:hypothetical protein